MQTMPSVRAARAPAAAAADASTAMQKSDKVETPPARLESATGAGSSAGELIAALHGAARMGRLAELERLLQQGAPINAVDGSGRTALILAVIHGHAPVVQRLLTLGANKSVVDKEGLGALDYARRLGLERMVSLIETGQ